MTDTWLNREDSPDAAADSVGAVIRQYRLASGRNQTAIAAELQMKQQHLSLIEKGKRPASVAQRRQFCQVLGIPPHDLGLSGEGGGRPPVAGEHESDAIAKSRGQWRAQRNWLNHHRSELAKVAVELYGTEHQVPRTPLIAAPGWIPSAPIDMDSIALTLDEGQQTTAVTGKEDEAAPTRPLRTADARFESYTSAIKHLDPPALFESRPSYRLLGSALAGGSLGFGLAAYFDKLNVSETLGHEMAAACMVDGLPSSAAELADKLPFRQLVGDPFDPERRAIIPAITTLTVRLRRWPEPPSFLLH